MQFIDAVNEFSTLSGFPKYQVISTPFHCPQVMKYDIAIHNVYCSRSTDPSCRAV